MHLAKKISVVIILLFLLFSPITRNNNFEIAIAVAQTPTEQTWLGSLASGFCEAGFTRNMLGECRPDSEIQSVTETLSGDWSKSIEYWTSGAFIVELAAYILIFAGRVFDGSIYYFVIQSSTYLQGGIGDSINEGWTIIRDIINLTFVFGLLYVAFMTVAKANTHDLKHAIPKILMYAILINFSLFFAKIVIDLSNVTTVEVYRAMSSEIKFEESAIEEGSSDVSQKGISFFFAKSMGIQSFFDEEKVGENQKRVGEAANFKTAILISIILLVAAFILLAGALLIAIRFVVLVLLLILSPVAFASGFIPKLNTEEWSHQWWSAMISQAIFAPAYLLMIWFAMKMANKDILSLGGDNNPEAALNPLSAGIGGIMNMVLVLGFLLGALIVAKKAGAYGAESSMKFGKSLAGNTSSLLLRNTAGRGSGWALKKFDTLQAGTSPGVRKFARLTGLSYAADGIRSGLEAGKKSKYGGSASLEDREHYYHELDKRAGNTKAAQDRDKALKNFKNNPSDIDARIAAERAISTMTTKELEEMGHDAHDPNIIGTLSHKQFEDYLKSDHHSATDRAHLADIRREQTENKLTTGITKDKLPKALQTEIDAENDPVKKEEMLQTGILAEGIGKANAQQLKAIGMARLASNPKFAAALSNGQMDDLKKELTETEYGKLKEIREGELWAAFEKNSSSFFEGKLEKDIAKLPKKILTNKNAAPYLNQEVLKRIADNNDLGKKERADILTNLEAAIADEAALYMASAETIAKIDKERDNVLTKELESAVEKELARELKDLELMGKKVTDTDKLKEMRARLQSDLAKKARPASEVEQEVVDHLHKEFKSSHKTRKWLDSPIGQRFSTK